MASAMERGMKHYALVTVIEATAELDPVKLWEAIASRVQIGIDRTDEFDTVALPVYLSDPYEVPDGPQGDYATESLMLVGDDDRRIYMFKSALEGDEPDPRERGDDGES